MAKKYAPFVVGERVHLKRRVRGKVLSGTITAISVNALAGRAVSLSLDDGSARMELAADLCRTVQRKRRAWLESERQGGGRRYWFRTSAECGAFARSKVAKGFHVADEGDNVWVSNGRERTAEVVNQQAGKEVEHG